MKPPTSRAGRVGLSLGALAAGAAAGGVVGRVYLSGSAQARQDAGTAAGALLGVTVAGLGGLALDKYTADGWGSVGGTTAAIGLGGVAALGAVALVNKIQALKTAGGGASSAVPQLPPKTYTATSQDSGRTLNMAVGDQLLITLPQTPTSGQAWQWAVTNGLLKWTSQSLPQAATNGTSESDTFTATAAGAGVVTASLTDGSGTVSATFTLNINVIAQGASS